MLKSIKQNDKTARKKRSMHPSAKEKWFPGLKGPLAQRMQKVAFEPVR